VDIDECSLDYLVAICGEGEVCHNLEGGSPGYECVRDISICNTIECDPGFYCDRDTGRCVEDVASCAAILCKEGFTCVEGRGCVDSCEFIEIACREGYECRNGGCQDINECTMPTFAPICAEEEWCVNTEGSYECSKEDPCNLIDCQTGYECKIGECVDIDECSLDYLVAICGEGEVCHNLEGGSPGYECVPDRVSDCDLLEFACAPGFERKGCECVPIEEEGLDFCASMRCAAGYACRNLPTKGKCEDINECKEEPGVCLADEVCINRQGSYECKQTGKPEKALAADGKTAEELNGSNDRPPGEKELEGGGSSKTLITATVLPICAVLLLLAAAVSYHRSKAARARKAGVQGTPDLEMKRMSGDICLQVAPAQPTHPQPCAVPVQEEEAGAAPRY